MWSWLKGVAAEEMAKGELMVKNIWQALLYNMNSHVDLLQ